MTLLMIFSVSILFGIVIWYAIKHFLCEEFTDYIANAPFSEKQIFAGFILFWPLALILATIQKFSKHDR